MVRPPRSWRMRTRTMLVVVGLCGVASGIYVLTWRSAWGPWPRWVRAIRSSDDYYNTTLNAAMRAVEGKDPDIAPEVAIPELIAVLDNPKDFPRIAAITALGSAGPKSAKAIPKLIALLKDQPSIQAHAANAALGEIVTRDIPEKDAAVSAFMAASNDSYPQTPAYALVRAHVLQALCRIVGPDDSRLPDLANLLTHSLADKSGRSQEAMPVLTGFRSGAKGYQTAQLVLGLLGSKSTEAIAALRTAAQKSSDPSMKKAAADALSQ